MGGAAVEGEAWLSELDALLARLFHWRAAGHALRPR